MNLGDPVAESAIAVTSVTVEKDVTVVNYEGDVGKYGRVFATHRLRASDEVREAYEFEGSARTLLEDGTAVSVSLRGIGRRSAGNIKLFSLDNASNGDQRLAVIEVDMMKKTASVKVYSV